jgi:acetyl-CoA carboxylase biotin carboxyl carrier protein
MEVDEIQALIELFERSTLTELTLEREGTRLILRRERGSSLPGEASPGKTTAASSPHASVAASMPEDTAIGERPAEEVPDGYVIRSPIVGTFYRRPSPEEEPYVEIGDRVDAGDTVCIVEAMKVMNEVRTERAGLVQAIPVEDATPVEYGQPLIAIEPFE